MRSASVLAFVTCVSAAMACTVTSTEGGGGPADNSSGGVGTGSSGKTGGPSGAPAPAPASPSVVDAKHPPPAATSSAPVEISAACPAFSACNASPLGTYDYKSGCIGDVFAEARKQCPGMQAVDVNAAVIGSITFDGAALARDVNAQVSATLVFPADCTLGQCTEVESALESGGFDSATCTAQSGGCSCAVHKTSSRNDYATYTISGSVLTTSDGDRYDLCEKSGTLSYEGSSTGSESGSFSLTKR